MNEEDIGCERERTHKISICLKRTRFGEAPELGRTVETTRMMATKCVPPCGANRTCGRFRAIWKAPRDVRVRSASSQHAVGPRVAEQGDVVTVSYVCKSEEDVVLDASSEEEPLQFEVGAGDVVGNALFQAFDDAVKGLKVGDAALVQAQGGEWKRELMFNVPIDHEEIQRLCGRYRNNREVCDEQGNLRPNALVELSNGNQAMVVDVVDGTVVLDCNNLMAGRKLSFEVKLLQIEGKSEAENDVEC